MKRVRRETKTGRIKDRYKKKRWVKKRQMKKEPGMRQIMREN